MEPHESNSARTRALYLELVKRAVTNYLYLGGDGGFESYYTDEEDRYGDSGWKLPRQCVPHALICKAQLDLLEKLMVDVWSRGVPGDFMEAGVWRGGAIIFMRAVLEAYGIDSRRIIAADSFAGIPVSTPAPEADAVSDWQDRWEAGYDEVRGHIARYGLDDRVQFVQGSFKESLPIAEIGTLSLLRLDVDAHESYALALDYLYPKLAVGGIVIIDDWHLPGCREAVHGYRKVHGIESPLRIRSRSGCADVFWEKVESGP